MNLKSKFQYVNMDKHGFPAKILELPYENDNLRMLLILPKKSAYLDLQGLDNDILDTNLGTTKDEC